MSIVQIPVATSSDLKRLEAYDTSVRKRGLIEMAIVRHLLTELVAGGFIFTVDDGEDEPVKCSVEIEEGMEAIFAVEDAAIYARKAGESEDFGYVRLVMGNDGWDVISDYTLNLEVHIAKTNAYAEALSAWC